MTIWPTVGGRDISAFMDAQVTTRCRIGRVKLKGDREWHQLSIADRLCAAAGFPLKRKKS